MEYSITEVLCVPVLHVCNDIFFKHWNLKDESCQLFHLLTFSEIPTLLTHSQFYESFAFPLLKNRFQKKCIYYCISHKQVSKTSSQKYVKMNDVEASHQLK